MAKAEPSLRLQDQLCYALYSASLEVNRLYKPSLDALGLTYPQFLAMLALWEQDAPTVREIADRLALESSTLTPLLKRLEASGFVRRTRDAGDERKVVVTLTDEGRALKQRAACVPMTMLTTSGFPVDRLLRLIAEVRALRDALVERAPAE